ncbi:GGDEF domain-containing protein [Coralloluteibacterium stylophorae]|uniref:diguanylate cyclase n=1 Tax=Coralloluteibacterium stylophorae TaxID=1776034 RepID=A0A8J7VVS1_9GAMM|nr:sensor domain-containing diguanylate cyclase [Coralloluteibacterium stylophorae]MBS7456144.1 sensor domain-containing diguanylate cyclase [Coralloluteibacterium stylophorae]
MHRDDGFEPLEPFASLRDVCSSALTIAREGSPLDNWMAARLEGDALVVEAVDAAGDGAPRVAERLPWRGTIGHRMAVGDCPYVVADVGAVEAYADRPCVARFGMRAYAGVPLVDHHGRLFGVLCGWSGRALALDVAAHEQRMVLAARVLSTYLALRARLDAVERRAEQAETASRTDPLTGLANRRGWDAAIEGGQRKLVREEASAAVVVADVDGLKHVNDNVGHEAGDALLVQVAQVLARLVRPSDTVARLGGDEFALLLDGVHRSQRNEVLSRLREALHAAGLQVSLGIACAERGHSLRRAFAVADARMLQDKAVRHAQGEIPMLCPMPTRHTA